jgi:hypothetical protein
MSGLGPRHEQVTLSGEELFVLASIERALVHEVQRAEIVDTGRETSRVRDLVRGECRRWWFVAWAAVLGSVVGLAVLAVSVHGVAAGLLLGGGVCGLLQLWLGRSTSGPARRRQSSAVRRHRRPDARSSELWLRPPW